MKKQKNCKDHKISLMNSSHIYFVFEKYPKDIIHHVSKFSIRQFSVFSKKKIKIDQQNEMFCTKFVVSYLHFQSISLHKELLTDIIKIL